MDTVDYAFVKSNGEIVNLCLIAKDDIATLNSLKDHYGVTDAIALDHVGHPSYITDLWDFQNNKWIITEIPVVISFPTTPDDGQEDTSEVDGSTVFN